MLRRQSHLTFINQYSRNAALFKTAFAQSLIGEGGDKDCPLFINKLRYFIRKTLCVFVLCVRIYCNADKVYFNIR